MVVIMYDKSKLELKANISLNRIRSKQKYGRQCPRVRRKNKLNAAITNGCIANAQYPIPQRAIVYVTMIDPTEHNRLIVVFVLNRSSLVRRTKPVIVKDFRTMEKANTRATRTSRGSL